MKLTRLIAGLLACVMFSTGCNLDNGADDPVTKDAFTGVSEVQNAQNEVDEATEILENAEENVTSAEAEVNEESAELEKVKDDLKTAKKKLETALANYNAGQEELKTAREELETAQTNLKTAEAELKIAQDDLANAQDKRDAAQTELADTQAKLDTALAELAEALEAESCHPIFVRDGYIWVHLSDFLYGEDAVGAVVEMKGSKDLAALRTASGLRVKVYDDIHMAMGEFMVETMELPRKDYTVALTADEGKTAFVGDFGNYNWANAGLWTEYVSCEGFALTETPKTGNGTEFYALIEATAVAIETRAGYKFAVLSGDFEANPVLLPPAPPAPEVIYETIYETVEVEVPICPICMQRDCKGHIEYLPGETVFVKGDTEYVYVKGETEYVYVKGDPEYIYVYVPVEPDDDDTQGGQPGHNEKPEDDGQGQKPGHNDKPEDNQPGDSTQNPEGEQPGHNEKPEDNQPGDSTQNPEGEQPGHSEKPGENGGTTEGTDDTQDSTQNPETDGETEVVPPKHNDKPGEITDTQEPQEGTTVCPGSIPENDSDSTLNVEGDGSTVVVETVVEETNDVEVEVEEKEEGGKIVVEEETNKKGSSSNNKGSHSERPVHSDRP